MRLTLPIMVQSLMLAAVAAADDVYVHVTGYDRWDDSNYEAPTDVSEWKVV